MPHKRLKKITPFPWNADKRSQHHVATRAFRTIGYQECCGASIISGFYGNDENFAEGLAGAEENAKRFGQDLATLILNDAMRNKYHHLVIAAGWEPVFANVNRNSHNHLVLYAKALTPGNRRALPPKPKADPKDVAL